MFGRYLTILLCAGLTLFSAPALAETYPSKPIKLVVGYGAGGGADAIARLYAAELQNILGTTVVVENKPGAYEQIAGRIVATAEPDGYTLLLGTTGGLVLGPLMQKLPYDAQADFTHVSLIAEADAVLAVRNGLPLRTVDELIAYARENPNKLNYASAGTGSVSHLLIEYIKMLTRVEMTHVPYKSAADVVAALVGENVDFAVAVPAAAEPLILSGRIQALAVTARERLPKLPDVPSVEEGSIEELKGMSAYAFYSISGPKGMSPEIVTTLSQAIDKAAKSPTIQARSLDVNFRPVSSSSTQLVQRIATETETWGNVMARLN